MTRHKEERTPKTRDLEITIIETPLEALDTEEGVRLAIMRDPSIIGEKVRIIAEEYRLPTGFLDLLGVDDEAFYLIETKAVRYRPSYNMVKQQGMNQLVKYFRGFTQQMKLFGLDKDVKPVLVIGVTRPHGSAKPVKYKVKAGVASDKETFKWKGLEKLEAQFKEREEQLFEKMLGARAVRLKDEAKSLAADVARLREEKARLEREIAGLKTALSRAKMERWGDKMLYVLAESWKPSKDKCFLCGGKGWVIVRVKGKDYALCRECWGFLVKLEEERLKPQLLG